MFRALSTLCRPLATLRTAPGAPQTWLASQGWLASVKRSILIVPVQQPARQGEISPTEFEKEVDKNEGMGIASFNRLVRQEIKRGSIRPGARYQKRFSRFVKPNKQRNLHREPQPRAFFIPGFPAVRRGVLVCL